MGERATYLKAFREERGDRQAQRGVFYNLDGSEFEMIEETGSSQKPLILCSR